MFEPAQLERAWLARADFKENWAFGYGDTTSVQYDLAHSSEIEEFNLNDDRTWALVRLDLDFSWTRVEGEGEAKPFDLSMSVRGAFIWDPPVGDESLARASLEYNGAYLLWPYARAYVAQITSASRLPALTIYTLTVPAPPDFAAERDEPSAENVHSNNL